MDPLKPCLALFSYGGLEAQTFDSLQSELFHARDTNQTLLYSRVHGDALISRSRSKALSAFLEKTDCNVFFMLDHDVEWEMGMVLETCQKAHERQAIVGGFYSCRGIGMGMSSRLKSEKATVKMGADELHDAEYIGGGFVAIPRQVAEEVLSYGLRARDVAEHGGDVNRSTLNAVLTSCIYTDGTEFYDFFRPIVVPSTMTEGAHEYLSEDWAFNWRARQANQNRPQYLWSKPVLRHWGTWGYMMKTSPKGMSL